MDLPIKTTAEDVRTIVRYLGTKPVGATLAEAKAAVQPTLVDSRKLTAYRAWGFVVSEGDRLKLTPRGWVVARTPERTDIAFREVIHDNAPYRSVLEWAYHQRFESISTVDIAAHWHEHHKAALGTAGEDRIKDAALAFLYVAEGAGVGAMTLGRRGHPTRLGINRSALEALIIDSPEANEVGGGIELDADDQADDSDAGAIVDLRQEPPPADPVTELPPAPLAMRVFISHGKNTEIVDQVQTMLGLADIESEVAVKEETTAIPVPEKVFAAMRRCQAGIITVTVDESRKDGSGAYAINENVLIEIGAAFVLYDRRVVLVWDKRIPVPSNLQGLYRCEFEGDELSWSAGMKLMKAIQQFKKEPHPQLVTAD